MEQRTAITFYVKLQKLFTETFVMIWTAYGDDVLSRTTMHTGGLNSLKKVETR